MWLIFDTSLNVYISHHILSGCMVCLYKLTGHFAYIFQTQHTRNYIMLTRQQIYAFVFLTEENHGFWSWSINSSANMSFGGTEFVAKSSIY